MPSSWYDDRCRNGVGYFAALYEAAVVLVPGGASICELGCGDGYFAKVLHSAGKLDNLYVGFDFSKYAISAAKKRNIPNASFRVVNLDRDLADRQLGKVFAQHDCFIALESLEHLRNDWLLVEMIPSKAHITFSVPNYNSRGHARFFNSQDDVKKRYRGLVEFTELQTIRVSDDGETYLCSGVRK